MTPNLTVAKSKMKVSQRCANTLGRGRNLVRGFDVKYGTCSVPDCGRAARSIKSGLCNTHYRRKLATGDPGNAPIRKSSEGETWEQSFWRQVEKSDGCWNWTGYKTQYGYGLLRKTTSPERSVHRLSWTLHVGPIPEGMQVHHTCMNRGCVNPDHLEVISPAEHTRLHNPPVERCVHGHEYTPENTYWQYDKRRGTKTRSCVTCRQTYYERQRDGV